MKPAYQSPQALSQYPLRAQRTNTTSTNPPTSTPATCPYSVAMNKLAINPKAQTDFSPSTPQKSSHSFPEHGGDVCAVRGCHGHFNHRTCLGTPFGWQCCSCGTKMSSIHWPHGYCALCGHPRCGECQRISIERNDTTIETAALEGLVVATFYRYDEHNSDPLSLQHPPAYLGAPLGWQCCSCQGSGNYGFQTHQLPELRTRSLRILLNAVHWKD